MEGSALIVISSNPIQSLIYSGKQTDSDSSIFCCGLKEAKIVMVHICRAVLS
jgi:hypothetical protein